MIIPDLHSTGKSQTFGLWTSSIDLGLDSYQVDHSLSLRLLKPFTDNIILIYGELPHVLPLAVHLEIFCADQVKGIILKVTFTLLKFLSSSGLGPRSGLLPPTYHHPPPTTFLGP